VTQIATLSTITQGALSTIQSVSAVTSINTLSSITQIATLSTITQGSLSTVQSLSAITSINFLSTVGSISGVVVTSQGFISSQGMLSAITSINVLSAVTSANVQADLINPTARTPLFAAFAFSATGPNQVVALDASNKIKVMGGMVMANGTVKPTWLNGTLTVAGPAFLTTNAGYILPTAAQYDYFRTSVNTTLVMSLDTAITVTGNIVYVKETS